MSEVTSKNFRAKVASQVVRPGKSIRENVQNLAFFAFDRYMSPDSNGDLSDAIYLFQAVAGVGSLNHTRFGQWAEDTFNVKVSKTQDGKPSFRKDGKGIVPGLRENADITAPWWEHGRSPEPKPLDLIKDLEGEVKKLEATQGDQPKRAIAAGQECAVTAAINELTGLIARVKRMINEAELSAACDDEQDKAA